MKTSTRLWAALTVVILAVAACGTSADDTTTTTAVEATTTTEAMPASSTTAGPQMSPAEQAALDAAGGEAIGGSVTMLGIIGGDELTAYETSVLAPFESATGIDVQFETTRDIGAVLQTRIDGGNPPDLATNSNVGQMLAFAEEGILHDVGAFIDDETLSQYDAALLDGVTVDGRLSAIYTAVNLEGFIWYNPNTYDGPVAPGSFDELQQWAASKADAGITPWCIGLESGAASGWPGAVWVTELVLRGAGPEVHTAWWQGGQSWASPEIREAFEIFGSIATDPSMVSGGPNAVLATNFAAGGDAMFSDPPQCFLHHQASFYGGIAQGTFPELEPLTDINAFPFPDVDPAYPGLRQVSGEVLGMFNDTPQAQALVRYLASAEAQTLIAETGIWLSPNKAVPLESYLSPFTRLSAETVQSAQGVYFDASALMPADMNAALSTAVLDYVANPDDLDTILQELEDVRSVAYAG